MEYIKKILSKLPCIKFQLYDKKFVISVAGIHATILSIMIALSAAYVLHFKSQINELEQNALAIAEDVNKISFSPIWYSLVSPGFKFVEKWSSTDEQLSMFIGRYFLDPKGETMTDHLNSPPFKVYFKDIGLNHTEFLLCLMAATALRSPFPERMVIQDKIKGLQPNPYKVFNNVKELESWIEEVKKKLKHFVDATRWFGPERFINNIYWSDKINIWNKFYENGRSDISQETLAEYKKIPEEFIKNVTEIYDISQSARNKIILINNLERFMPSKCVIYVFLILASVAFFSGVIFPIFKQTIFNLFIFWFPVVFYSIFLLYLMYKVVINLR